VANLPSVQAGLAALALAVIGGAALLLAGLLLSRARRMGALRGEAEALLRDVPDALGDAAFLLDAAGRVLAASAVAEMRFPPGALLGRRIEELLGEQAALLRRGLARGLAAGRLEYTGAGPAHTVLVRVGARPVRDLVVMRFDRPRRPPPLPEPVVGPPPRARAAARADLAALGAALQGPVQQAATAAGLLRLSWPGSAVPRELERLESALEEAERRTRTLQAGAHGSRELAAVDLAALVGDVLGGAPAWRARLRPDLAPARAWVDPGRVRSALREVLRATAEAVPAGAEVSVRVGVRSGAVVLELGPAVAGAAVGEAAALARALLATEGGEVVLESVPGRGGVCRISLPSAAEM
jgi:signal transduction histidine kinase